MVDSHNIEGNAILRGSRDDNFLGSSYEMLACSLLRSEGTCALSDVLSTSVSPLEGGGFLVCEHFDLVAVDNDAVCGLLNFSLECSYR